MGERVFMGHKEFSIKDLEFENFKVSLEKEKQKEEDALAVSFSSKLVGLLKTKAETHNASSLNEVSLSDLKRVYRRAGKDCELAQELEKTCGQLSLARVSMFLRFKLGEKMKARRSAKAGASIDISDTWLPSEEDFDLADKEIEEHKLDYDFESSDQLYLEDYEKPSRDWI